jgi:hypothetical protein
MIRVTTTNGNARNRIPQTRVRWTCTECGERIAEHFSPARGPAGFYEDRYPGGFHAAHYRECLAAAAAHKCGGE